MIKLAEAIFSVAMALPAPYVPPATAEAVKETRREFLSTLAAELASVADEATCSGEWAALDFCKRIWPGSQLELVAAVLTVGKHESLLDARIQAGKCKVWGPGNAECDAVKLPDGTTWFRAQSVFQLHGRFQEPVVGLEWFAVRNAAKQAVRVLAASKKSCRTWEGMFAAYAGTRSCGWHGAAGRVKTFRQIEAALGRAITANTRSSESNS